MERYDEPTGDVLVKVTDQVFFKEGSYWNKGGSGALFLWKEVVEYARLRAQEVKIYEAK